MWLVAGGLASFVLSSARRSRYEGTDGQDWRIRKLFETALGGLERVCHSYKVPTLNSKAANPKQRPDRLHGSAVDRRRLDLGKLI